MGKFSPLREISEENRQDCMRNRKDNSASTQKSLLSDPSVPNIEMLKSSQSTSLAEGRYEVDSDQQNSMTKDVKEFLNSNQLKDSKVNNDEENDSSILSWLFSSKNKPPNNEPNDDEDEVKSILSYFSSGTQYKKYKKWRKSRDSACIMCGLEIRIAVSDDDDDITCDDRMRNPHRGIYSTDTETSATETTATETTATETTVTKTTATENKTFPSRSTVLYDGPTRHNGRHQTVHSNKNNQNTRVANAKQTVNLSPTSLLLTDSDTSGSESFFPMAPTQTLSFHQSVTVITHLNDDSLSAIETINSQDFSSDLGSSSKIQSENMVEQEDDCCDLLRKNTSLSEKCSSEDEHDCITQNDTASSIEEEKGETKMIPSTILPENRPMSVIVEEDEDEVASDMKEVGSKIFSELEQGEDTLGVNDAFDVNHPDSKIGSELEQDETSEVTNEVLASDNKQISRVSGGIVPVGSTKDTTNLRMECENNERNEEKNDDGEDEKPSNEKLGSILSHEGTVDKFYLDVEKCSEILADENVSEGREHANSSYERVEETNSDVREVDDCSSPVPEPHEYVTTKTEKNINISLAVSFKENEVKCKQSNAKSSSEKKNRRKQTSRKKSSRILKDDQKSFGSDRGMNILNAAARHHKKQLSKKNKQKSVMRGISRTNTGLSTMASSKKKEMVPRTSTGGINKRGK